MQVLLSVCCTRDEMALQDLHDQGAIPLLIGTAPLITAHLSLSLREPLCAGIVRQCVGELGREREREREKAERVRVGKRLALESGLLLELQSDTLITISCLCETDIHRKVSRRGERERERGGAFIFLGKNKQHVIVGKVSHNFKHVLSLSLSLSPVRAKRGTDSL